MMVYNKAIRPRYFWCLTEWLRNNFADLKDNYKIVHGTENNYRLPHHPTGTAHPGRSFATWPLAAYTRYHTPATVIYDAYLMKLGKETFTTSVLPDASDGAPVDGILVVLVNLALLFEGIAADPANAARRDDFARRIFQAFDNGLNRKVFAEFNIDNPAVPGDPRKFSKCYVHFVLRFNEAFVNGAHMLVKLRDTANSTVWGGDVKQIRCKLPAGVAWNAALTTASDYAIKEILKGLGLSEDVTDANGYTTADAYIPILKSVAPGITPTMTRL